RETRPHGPGPRRSSRCGIGVPRPSRARNATGEWRPAATTPAWRGSSSFLRRGGQNAADDVRHAVPVARFFLQLFAPGGREPVKARPALVLGLAPLARDEALVLEAIQRRIERALLDAEALLRDLLDAEQDAVAVERAERNGLEDQHVERPLQQFGWLAHRRFSSTDYESLPHFS